MTDPEHRREAEVKNIERTVLRIGVVVGEPENERGEPKRALHPECIPQRTAYPQSRRLLRGRVEMWDRRDRTASARRCGKCLDLHCASLTFDSWLNLSAQYTSTAANASIATNAIMMLVASVGSGV